MSNVFIIPFHVKPGPNSIMPTNFVGAYVSCYASSDDFEQAARACLAALDGDGLLVEEILQPIHSMHVSQWALHVSDQWPEHKNQMPSQVEFETSMNAGKVVYGPFGSYGK